MGRLKAKSDYEELREARVRENQARLASLGLQKTISELRSLTSSPKSEKTHVRKWCKVDYSSNPLRRSSRLRGKSPQGKLSYLEDEDGKGKDHSNRPLVGAKRDLRKSELSPEALARRCGNKGRGSLYDPVYGICCHFCRQKKLCGEEDCKRCGNLDMDQPCIGKTDCSLCHSTNGILCRACLRVRYGEEVRIDKVRKRAKYHKKIKTMLKYRTIQDTVYAFRLPNKNQTNQSTWRIKPIKDKEMEEVRANKAWICPHCMEDKGINPYWICNSSFCLKKRKMVPTGIAIFRAREMGYKSVAHLLMDELKRADKGRC